MMQKKILNKSLIISFCFLFLTFIAISFIDKPLAIFIHSNDIDTYLLINLKLRYLTEGLPFLTLSFCLIYIIASPPPKCGNKYILVMYIYLILKLTVSAKDGLKVIFGRFWINSWLDNNLSLIQNGVYGFNWLHGYHNQSSFPSGHTTYVAVLCFFMLNFYPHLKKLWISLITLMVLSLILANFHFLGDCLGAIVLAQVMVGLSLIIYNAIIQFKIFKNSSIAQT